MYDHLFKGSVHYDYDERIDEYNWVLIFAVQLVFYFVVQWGLRKWLPEPGTKKSFIERGKLQEYHFYYFQYTSMIHALTGCVGGKFYFRIKPFKTM